MGLWDKIKGEFIDIIEWLDDTNDTLVYKFERYNNEIKNGAKLTVREGQVAVLVDEGKMADIYQPGMYTLDTSNMPILSTLKGWKYGFNSPFKVDVYFFSMRDFTDQKWGTKNPIMLRDPEFGPIRIRAFGNYAFRIKTPETVLKRLVSTDARFTVNEINEQLRNVIITRFTDVMGESKIPILDAASNYNEFSEFLTQQMGPEFDKYGLECSQLLVENISLPPNVEEMLDKRTSMGIIGDMAKFTQFQVANSIEKAAENEGGGAGAFVGAGMGFGMGNQIMSSFNQQNQQNNQNTNIVPPPIPGEVDYFVAVNGQQTGPFKLAKIEEMVKSSQIARDTLMWKAGMAGWMKAETIQEIAQLFTLVPPPIS